MFIVHSSLSHLLKWTEVLELMGAWKKVRTLTNRISLLFSSVMAGLIMVVDVIAKSAVPGSPCNLLSHVRNLGTLIITAVFLLCCFHGNRYL